MKKILRAIGRELWRFLTGPYRDMVDDGRSPRQQPGDEKIEERRIIAAGDWRTEPVRRPTRPDPSNWR